MSEEIIKEVLIEAYDIEFAELDRFKRHIFSRAHKRKMKALFNSLYNNKEEVRTPHPKLKSRHRLSLVLVLIITSILLGITVVAIATNGFKFTTKPTHTQVLAAGWEDAPEIIEDYYIIDIPDDFILEGDSGSELVYTIEYTKEDDFIKFRQFAKKSYNATYNTEGYEYEELIFDDHNAFYIQWKNYNALVWDNGDYIMEIQSTMYKDDLVKLAKSAKILEK